MSKPKHILIQEDHCDLALIMWNHGDQQEKKHGKWIILKLNDDWFLQMDSHNSYIHLKQGSGEYEYWNGFSGKKWMFLGGNFGGFSHPENSLALNAMIKRVNNWINIKRSVD